MVEYKFTLTIVVVRHGNKKKYFLVTNFLWMFRLKYYNLLQHKLATNANCCFKRGAETSLGIVKGPVNVRNANVFINGIRFAD